MSVTLFDDIFVIQDVDPGGRKFEKVSRVVGVGESYEMHLVLDINCEIYRVRTGDRLILVLARTLNEDGTPSDSQFDQRLNTRTLADDYEYVMYGRVFRVIQKTEQGSAIELYASFGGLLMSLKGLADHVKHIELDQRLYLLLRKVPYA